MLYRMVRPVTRKGSRNPGYARRIPVDVQARALGLTLDIPIGDATQITKITPAMCRGMIRVSLRTSDPVQVKARQAAVDAYLETVWQALRTDTPVPLTHKQATALAGELYRAWAQGEERGEQTFAMEHVPGEGWQRVNQDFGADEWEAVQPHWENLGASTEPKDLEAPLGAIIDRQVLAKGIKQLDEAARATILTAFWLAARDAFALRRRNAEGDYSPDAKSERFPVWQPPNVKGAERRPGVSLNGLREAWWTESKALGLKPSTNDSYSHAVASFVAFLKHDDASRVTKSDVVRFKDFRLASINPRTGKSISGKTVKDSDLAGLKTIFGWAVSNGKLAANPAEGVTLKLKKPRRLRGKGFTQAEAIAILTASTNLKQGGEAHTMFSAKRWVPWLCAYTGARVGEMAQLRKEDIRQEGPHWYANITPEAGRVKTDVARVVVIHPHLLEQGFIAFVNAVPPGYLFVKGDKAADARGRLKGVTNRLADFAREIVTDPNVAPNHGWRHRFKTIGMEAQIDPRILDAIQGHSPRTDGEGYGEVTIKTQAEAIAKFPRYMVPTLE